MDVRTIHMFLFWDEEAFCISFVCLPNLTLSNILYLLSYKGNILHGDDAQNDFWDGKVNILT